MMMTAADVAATFAAQRNVDPLVIDLARALSLATRVETELVRLMRLELFPESDVGLEPNLWFSPLVAQRDALGLSLVAECRDELRRELMLPQHRATLQCAWRVIVDSHRPEGQAGIAPVLTVQEAVTYHALAAAVPVEARAHRQAMQIELGTLINALDNDSDGALARWIVRALPTLPETARRSPAAITLAEKLRARDSAIVLDAVPHAAMNVSSQSPLWAADGVDVGCRRRTDGIEFSVPPAEDARRLKLPDTSPLALEVLTPSRDGWHTRSVTFEPQTSHVVADPTPASRCRITTLNGQEIAIQPTFGSGKPTLAVIGLRGPDDPRRGDIGAATADLGWQLWTLDEESSPGSDRADAVLIIGKPPAAARYLENPLSSLLHGNGSVLALMPNGVEPIGSNEPTTVLNHGDFVFSAEFSPDASRIATAGREGVLLWDAATGQLLMSQTFDDVSRGATFSPDSSTLAIACNDGRVRMWRPPGSEVTLVDAHDDWVMSAEFSRNGRRLVTASQDHTAALWIVNGGLQRSAIIEHRAAVNHASFSPDESRVATASDDRTVFVSDVQSGTRLAILQHDAEVHSAVWSPDGGRILTADAGGKAWLWSALTHEREPLAFSHEHEIHFATFSADGRRIAAATADGHASVWHVPSRALMAAPLQHAEPVPGPARKGPGSRALRSRRDQGVYSVTFSPDGTQLLTGGSDGRAIVWDLLRPHTAEAVHEVVKTALAEPDPLEGRLTETHLQSLRAQLLALDEQRLIAWAQSAAVVEPPATSVAPDEPPVEPFEPTEKGDKALIALLSDGIDVLHKVFLDNDGRSRITAIWDQRDTTGPPPRGFDFGTFHGAERIAAYVSEDRVPDALGRNRDGLGTVDASIAAGGAVGEFKGGVAPGASILVVITSNDEPVGYSTSHLEALRFVEEMATALASPVVVHVGQGMHAGAHDGTSPLELAFDQFSKGGRAPGRAIVKSAGNDGDARQHAEVTVPPNSADKINWTCRDVGRLWLRDRMELWWNSANTFKFRLTEPTGSSSDWVDMEHPEIQGRLGGVSYNLSLIRRHIDNGDSRLLVELGNGVSPIPPGEWSLEINSVHVVEVGQIHAWIERSGMARSEFVTHHSESMTLSIPGTAVHVITVGAIESASPFRIAAFSASGPTRDGREKPDVAAPGVNIMGARGGTAHDVITMSGTTLAAARVAGAVALVFSSVARTGGALPTADQVAQELRATTANYSGRWDRRQGYGVVDIAKFVAAMATAWGSA